MTLVQKEADGTYRAVSGARRLRTMLDVNGWASVTDVESRETLIVAEVNGCLVLSQIAEPVNRDGAV
ncbi:MULTISPECIES: hypothetical protein [Paraburkholderia]|nr:MULTISPECIES: hypothetical protein [Paraburkholderia]MCX4175689.1 hypothetical protein [Paraburkholderia madseniana]MDQ6463684.1 hypothetical protein [Paraburkholderia madseniana]